MAPVNIWDISREQLRSTRKSIKIFNMWHPWIEIPNNIPEKGQVMWIYNKINKKY